MTTEALKSTPVTNLDTDPPVANTAGEGAPGRLLEVSGYVTVSASMAAGSTYQLCRIPSNCKVKSVIFESGAQGAGKFNLGLYYSTGPYNSTLTAVSAAFFASDIDCASAVGATEVVNESGTYTVDKRNMPIWQAAGLTSDPGGFFDVVATVHTTDVTTGTGKLAASVRYVA